MPDFPMLTCHAWARCLVFLLASVGLASFAAATPPRIALTVSAGDDSPAWQSLFTAELSRIAPEVGLVERAELARAWTEREQAALAGIATTPAPLGVDFYLNFRRVSEDRWIVERVDAATGRALGAYAVTAAETEFATRVAAAGARLLAEPVPTMPGDEAPRIAVVESVDARADAALFGLAAHLRAAFAEAGLIVLDRALTQEMAVEQNAAKGGMRATAAASELLGLDYWMELSPTGVRVVRARDGVLLGMRAFAADGERDNEPGSLRGWALSLLDRKSPAKTDAYLPQVETEALEPFYRGLGLYDAGRFIEATTEFTRAWLANDRFAQAYEWEARCYEALGMSELASAVRRFLQIGQVENMTAASSRTDVDAVVAFVGVIPSEDTDDAALARSLSVQIASRLATRRDLEIRMPDQLARLRQEYDWMRGADVETAPRWENAQGLFSRETLSVRLERKADDVFIRWIRRDMISGTTSSGEPMALASDTALWPRQIESFVDSWKVASAGVRIERDPDAQTDLASSPRRLASEFARAPGLQLNAARLRLALAEPGNMLIQGRRFQSGRTNGIESYPDMLEYALREWRIRHLPEDSATRRWLELERAREHIGPYSFGESRRGESLDGIGELVRLAAPPRLDAVGILAQHFLLYARQAQMPPGELFAACEALLVELALIDPAKVPEQKLILAQVTALARTARLAADLVPPGESFIFSNELPEPRLLSLEWQRDGNPILRGGEYPVSMRYLDRQTPAERVQAARLALAVNGRSEPHVNPGWLEEFPDSLELAGPITRMLHDMDKADGLPITYPFEPERQRAHVRAVMDKQVDQLERWMERADDVMMMSHLAGYLGGAASFFHLLHGHTMQEWVSDADYEVMHRRVLTAYDAAAARLGYKRLRSAIADRAQDWRSLTRDMARERRQDFLRDPGPWVMNPVILRKQLRETEVALERRQSESGGAYDFPAWWKKLREWQFTHAFSAPEMAEFYARRAPEALAYLRAQERPKLEDAQAFLEQALWLHYGRREAEAEPLYRALLELSPGSVSPSAAETELRTNAAFRLAQIAHFDGRHAEAIAFATRCLELGEGASPRLIAERFTNKWNDYDLRTVCTRLLRELRFDPARLALPDRTRVVSVRTPNGDNPLLRVLYRLPPDSTTVEQSARRVVVITPTNNQDPLDYLLPGGEWARFADAHDLVLIVPQFVASDTPMRADNRFTHSRYAQVWSGAALLEAVDKIGEVTPLRKERLLMYGQTTGGGFSAMFAAWRPDLVAAVAVVNGNWSMPRTALPGLRPRSEWRSVQFHVSAGELNNYRGDSGMPRYDSAVDFVTRLMGDGVPVEWRSWPDVYHEPTPQMENDARAFLARQLER